MNLKHNNLFLFWLLFIVLVAGMVASGILTRRLSNDEAVYYLPAIKFIAEAFPAVSVADYPFPAPPLGLFFQALVYKYSGGNPISMRIFSCVLLIILSLIVFTQLSRISDQWRSGLFMLALLCFPFFFQHGFTMRQHVLSVICLLSCYFFVQEVETGTLKTSLIHSALLTCAVLINQMCAGYCVTLILWKALHLKKLDMKEQLLNCAILTVPLLTLCCLFLLWGGSVPPSYHAVAYKNPTENLFLVRPNQIVLALLSVGLWIVPLYQHRKALLKWAALLWLPLVLVMDYAGGFQPGISFYDSIVGPVTTTSRLLTGGSYWVMLLLLGVPVSFGAAFLGTRRSLSSEWNFVRLYAVVYGLMMNAVPSFFESYYMYFLVLSYWHLREQLVDQRQTKYRAALFLGAVAIIGILYTNATLFFRR